MASTLKNNQLIRKIAKHVPLGKQIDQLYRYGTYKTHYKSILSKNNIEEEDLLIIGTIARSGTHYMMMLLANYIAKTIDADLNIGPTEMNKMFPNNWHLNYMSYHQLPLGPFNLKAPEPPNDLIKNIGLTEITRSHSIFQPIYWKRSPVLHLYRNPLDYAVSLYNYKHKKRPDLPDRCESPDEVLSLKFKNYIEMYKSYKMAAQSGRYTLLRFSYENLVSNPPFYLKATLQWLGHEPDPELVVNAVHASSIKKVQTAELTGSAVNPDAHDLHGSFISSGQIGQWKEYFSNKELRKWELAFQEQGLGLKAFILE